MSFSTYSDLKTSILTWLGRPGDPLIPTDDLIRLFEADANRRLRTHFQETSIEITTEAGTAVYELPDDLLQIREVKITSLNPLPTLDYLTPAQLDTTWILDQTGQPFNYTLEGSNIRFGPIPAGEYTVEIKYFQEIPPLSDNAYGLVSFVVVDGGTGYSVDDVLVISGGTPVAVALIVVDTVDDDGVILTAHVGEAGDYSVRPSDPVSVTGGTGNDDATFDLTFDNNGGATNWLLQTSPDCYLFGALAEAEIFLGSEETAARFATLLKRRDLAYAEIQLADRKYRIGGTPLIMRNSGGAP
jgi:hypothetical protein